MLQRRRRVEEEVELISALKSKTDDVGVLIDWAGQGEDVADELSAGIEQFASLVEGGEIKKMLGGEHDRKNAIITIHPAPAAPSLRTGPKCCCACISGGLSAVCSSAR